MAETATEGASATDVLELEEARSLLEAAQAAGRVNAALPERVRYMPIAYQARRTARAQQALEHALDGRPM